jgi:hypothetical protein
MFGGGAECDLMDDDGWMRDKKSQKAKDAKDMLLWWDERGEILKGWGRVSARGRLKVVLGVRETFDVLDWKR